MSFDKCLYKVNETLQRLINARQERGDVTNPFLEEQVMWFIKNTNAATEIAEEEKDSKKSSRARYYNYSDNLHWPEVSMWEQNVELKGNWLRHVPALVISQEYVYQDALLLSGIGTSLLSSYYCAHFGKALLLSLNLVLNSEPCGIEGEARPSMLLVAHFSMADSYTKEDVLSLDSSIRTKLSETPIGSVVELARSMQANKSIPLLYQRTMFTQQMTQLLSMFQPNCISLELISMQEKKEKLGNLNKFTVAMSGLTQIDLLYMFHHPSSMEVIFNNSAQYSVQCVKQSLTISEGVVVPSNKMILLIEFTVLAEMTVRR